MTQVKRVKYKDREYVLADSIDKGPLTLKAQKLDVSSVKFDVVLLLKDKDNRLLFRALVDFDGKRSQIWFLEDDLFEGVKKQLQLEDNDVWFEFEGKKYFIVEIDKTKDKNYYFLADIA